MRQVYGCTSNRWCSQKIITILPPKGIARTQNEACPTGSSRLQDSVPGKFFNAGRVIARTGQPAPTPGPQERASTSRITQILVRLQVPDSAPQLPIRSASPVVIMPSTSTDWAAIHVMSWHGMAFATPPAVLHPPPWPVDSGPSPSLVKPRRVCQRRSFVCRESLPAITWLGDKRHDDSSATGRGLCIAEMHSAAREPRSLWYESTRRWHRHVGHCGSYQLVEACAFESRT